MDMQQRLQFATMAHSARSDLRSADAIFRASPSIENWLVAFKIAAVSLGNVVDFEPLLRAHYQTAPELAGAFRAFERSANFCRYLRNTFVAHQNPSLIAQALEWKPEIRSMVLTKDARVSTVIDLFILETAINTYVLEGGAHKVFDSETDMIYPPDFNRFNVFLEETITSALIHLDLLIEKLLNGYVPPTTSEGFAHAVKAGQIDFGFVTKGKR